MHAVSQKDRKTRAPSAFGRWKVSEVRTWLVLAAEQRVLAGQQVLAEQRVLAGQQDVGTEHHDDYWDNLQR